MNKILENAALCLRDDPTLHIMSSREKDEEARVTLVSMGIAEPDDGMIGEVVKLALSKKALEATAIAAPAPAQILPVADRAFMAEPCRIGEGQACVEKLGGTGRCISCGAQRAQPAVTLAPSVESVVPETKKERKKRTDFSKKATAKKKEMLAQVSGKGYSITNRFSAATGMTDESISMMIGKSRGTIQAYREGRRNEHFTDAAIKNMVGSLLAHLDVINELIDDIHKLPR